MKAARRKPEIVLRNGKPSAVILDITEYQELLERVEDAADLKRLRDMRAKGVTFKPLSVFLRERKSRV